MMQAHTQCRHTHNSHHTRASHSTHHDHHVSAPHSSPPHTPRCCCRALSSRHHPTATMTLAQGASNRGADYAAAAAAALAHASADSAADDTDVNGTSGPPPLPSAHGPTIHLLTRSLLAQHTKHHASLAPSSGGIGGLLRHDTSHGSLARVARLSSLPPDVARIIDAARQLFEVRSMQDHWQLAQSSLAPDVVWQAPIIATDNRHSLRAAVYVAKSIAHLTLDPHYVEVVPLGGRTLLLLDATVTVIPKRTWLLPPTLLLPGIPLRATIKLGVKGPLESGKIELIDGRWHNLPSAPAFICNANGLLMGLLLAATEGLWGRLLPLVGDAPADASYARDVLGVSGGGHSSKKRLR